MTTFSKHNLAQRFRGLKAQVRHAFAMDMHAEALSIEDMALLERVADAVIKRGMAAPATLFLESIGPMNFLGSQAVHFLIPILEVVFPARDLERVARLLECRDTLSRLILIIESRSDVQRTAPSR